MGKTGPDKAPTAVHDTEGIDAGWDYNVGKAAWGENRAKVLMESEGKWKDMDPRGPVDYGRPEKIAVDQPKAAPASRVKPGDIDALRETLWKAVGGDSVPIQDPLGEPVRITQAIAHHIAESAGRWDGREMYFPLIPELIEDPYEIWVNFAKNEVSGRVAIRKKYVKAVKLDKNRVLGLYAEEQDGVWISGDFFRGGLTGAGNLRKGRLLYGRN